MYQEKNLIEQIYEEMEKRIIGQKDLIRDLVITLLAKGHILLEGVPGLAKTLAIETLANILDVEFKRIQFTPDLLPSDLVGSMIYNQSTGTLEVKKGPVFANFILADEINRAPSKIQSALLESMQEHQVTIGEETYPLPSPFFVLATTNPLEQEGTFPLPEAQLDRFLLKTIVAYPTAEEEIQIMKQEAGTQYKTIQKIMNADTIETLQKTVQKIYVDEKIYTYARDIILSTRNPEDFGMQDITRFLNYGASPRASIALIKTAQALAFIEGRNYVIPEDIKTMCGPVLRHRLLLSYEARAQKIQPIHITHEILSHIPVP